MAYFEGQLPPDAIEQHVEHEYRQTFGQDYKVDAEGNVIEQGRGSKAQPTRGRSTLTSKIKPNGARWAGAGIRGDPRAHGSDLAAYNASKPQPVKRRPARPSAT